MNDRERLKVDTKPFKLRIESEPYAKFLGRKYSVVLDVFDVKRKKELYLSLDAQSLSQPLYELSVTEGLLRDLEIWVVKSPDDEFGVYSIWSKNVCIYVGQAKHQSLQSRLRQHYNGSHNGKLNAWIKSSHPLWFCVEPTKNIQAIDAKERNRIKKYAPLTNKLLLKKEYQYGHYSSSF